MYPCFSNVPHVQEPSEHADETKSSFVCVALLAISDNEFTEGLYQSHSWSLRVCRQMRQTSTTDRSSSNLRDTFEPVVISNHRCFVCSRAHTSVVVRWPPTLLEAVCKLRRAGKGPLPLCYRYVKILMRSTTHREQGERRLPKPMTTTKGTTSRGSPISFQRFRGRAKQWPANALCLCWTRCSQGSTYLTMWWRYTSTIWCGHILLLSIDTSVQLAIGIGTESFWFAEGTNVARHM